MSDAAVREPIETYQLSGHEAAETAFLDAMRRGRLHHAWLLTGPRGVGKASFAYRAARRLLGAKPDPGHGALGASPEDPVCRRMEAGAHGDLMVLSRPFDEKRGRYKGVITVEEARRLTGWMTTTAGEGGWRVAIVDAADDLNVNAANAILKTLEEPPARTVMFLVCHALGRLPTTVRSRCRRLNFRPLSEAETTAVVRDALNLSSDAKAAEAAALAPGRPGEAVRLAAAGCGTLSSALDRLLAKLPSWDDAGALKIAETVGGRDAEDLQGFYFDALSRHALIQARTSGAAESWGRAWDRTRSLEREMTGLNLDPRVAALEALGALREAAQAGAS